MADQRPPKAVTAGAEFDETYPYDDPPTQTVGDKILRYSQLKNAQAKLTDFLLAQHCEFATLAGTRLRDCGTWLTFRDYYTVQSVKLVGACFCKRHTLCQLCAVRRSAKFLQQTLPKFESLIADSSVPLVPHLIVLTIKNGENLGERIRHLESSWQKLLRRKSKLSKYPKTLFRDVVGGIMSIEVTNIGNGWHPHANVMCLSTEPSFDWAAAKAEWLEITGDSKVVNFSTDASNLQATLAETIKYVTKFADLTPRQTWDLHRTLRSKRTVRGFGKLWGLRPPLELTDAPLADELPFIDYLCRWLGADGYTILRALRCAAGASEAEPSVSPRQRARARRLARP